MTGHLKAMLNEIRLELIEMKRYPFSLVTGMVSQVVIFFGILILVEGFVPFDKILNISPGYGYKSFLLIGFILWNYATMVVYSISGLVSYERYTGTLQQKFISPSPPSVILLGHSLGNLFIASIKNTAIIAILVIFARIKIEIPLSSLLIVGLTLLGLYGFAFFLAGLSLMVRRMEMLASYFLDFVFLFFCGVIAPIEKLPPFIQAIGYSIPLARGIKLLRGVMLDGAPLILFIKNGEFFGLVLSSVLCLSIGVYIYHFGERTARIKGDLVYF